MSNRNERKNKSSSTLIIAFLSIVVAVGLIVSQNNLTNDSAGQEVVLGTPGLEYQLIDGKQEYQLVGEGTATDKHIVVASVYNDLPVTKIADRAFIGGLENHPFVDTVVSVFIPEGITDIGDNTFLNCKNLESVRLPNTLTHLGERAFYSNVTLREKGCTLNNGLLYLGNENNPYVMLYYVPDAQNLTTVKINENCKFIGANVFYEAVLITEVTFPEGVLEIGYQPFVFCAELTKISLPSTLTRIGTNFLKSCKQLQTVTYAGTVEQWDKIIKDNKWDSLMTTPLTEITCSNGSVKLK